MKKLTFGTPEPLTPSRFCAGFNPQDTPVRYDTAAFTFRETARGCVLEFPLTADEELYGFGLQLKEFAHKHRKLLLRPNSDPVAATGDSHAPVPFFVSTRGYGMYFDTARCVEVYCGFAKKQNRKPNADNSIIANADDLYRKTGLHEPVTMAVEIPSAKGIDVYLFEGDNILDIVSQYNMMAGGGCTVPDWGLGTLYRAYAKYTDAEVLQLADYFEKNDLPVQTIGLEPGWQSSSYSCSYVWDSERYPNHEAMVAELRRRGYHINLWEHAFVNAVSPIYSEIFPYCGDYEVWKGIVPDFAVPEARRIFADYHRNTLTSRGIDGFKLDECDNSDFVHSDWSFPNCSTTSCSARCICRPFSGRWTVSPPCPKSATPGRWQRRTRSCCTAICTTTATLSVGSSIPGSPACCGRRSCAMPPAAKTCCAACKPPSFRCSASSTRGTVRRSRGRNGAAKRRCVTCCASANH